MTKEQILQELASSLLRDFFAGAALSGMLANHPAGMESTIAFDYADRMLEKSYTPKILNQLKDLRD